MCPAAPFTWHPRRRRDPPSRTIHVNDPRRCEIPATTDCEYSDAIEFQEGTGGRRLQADTETFAPTAVGTVRVFRFAGFDGPTAAPTITSAPSSPCSGVVLLGEEVEGGAAVAVNHDRAAGAFVAVGAPESDGARGAVRVYEFDGSDWELRGAFYGFSPDERVGAAVALNGDGSVVAVGAPGAGGGAGRVEVYAWNADAWARRGADVEGSTADAAIGGAIALDGSGAVLAVGSARSDAATGVVLVLGFDGATWVGNGEFRGDAAGDGFGSALALSFTGNVIAVGAPGAGIVRVYESRGASWEAVADLTGTADEEFGSACSLSRDGQVVAIGASASAADSGRVAVYGFSAADWVQLGDDLVGAAGDRLGGAVSIGEDGDVVLAGAEGGNYARYYMFGGEEWESFVDVDGSSVAASADATLFAVGDGGAGSVGVYDLYPAAPNLSKSSFCVHSEISTSRPRRCRDPPPRATERRIDFAGTRALCARPRLLHFFRRRRHQAFLPRRVSCPLLDRVQCPRIRPRPRRCRRERQRQRLRGRPRLLPRRLRRRRRRRRPRRRWFRFRFRHMHLAPSFAQSSPRSM